MGHAQVGHSNSDFNVNTDSRLVWRSCADEELQIVVAPWLFQRILIQSHHPLIAALPSQRRNGNTQQHKFYLLYMTAVV